VRSYREQISPQLRLIAHMRSYRSSGSRAAVSTRSTGRRITLTAHVHTWREQTAPQLTLIAHVRAYRTSAPRARRSRHARPTGVSTSSTGRGLDRTGARPARRVGRPSRDNGRMPSQPDPRRQQRAAFALAALLVTTGVLHFVRPRLFESIVPEVLGSPRFWVAASGVAELGCAAALAVSETRRAGGWACAVLFVAVFPANVVMAIQSLRGEGSVLVAFARLPLQVPLVLWALYVAGALRSGNRAVRRRRGSASG
jgi:uncharacterized membrane protein